MKRLALSPEISLGRDELASNPGFPFRILCRSFGEKSEGKPGTVSHVIRWHRDVMHLGLRLEVNPQMALDNCLVGSTCYEH